MYSNLFSEEFEGAELAFVYSQIVHEIREFSFESVIYFL